MINLHVEPTSRCTLECPRCERTEFIKKFGKKNFSVVDLDIDAFESFVDVPVESILFCGNLGDPIYHRDFIQLVRVSKTLCNHISIITNGSRKSLNWWKDLNSCLTSDDKIIFSVDGIPDNFTQYRVNADWESIKIGIEQCVQGPAITVWKYIPFSFNEDDINTAEQLSKSLGVDIFLIENSDRWYVNDPLRPTKKYIGPRDQIQQSYKQQKLNEYNIDPKCKNNSEHYISADGYYTPCCYSKNFSFYYKSHWWKERNKHLIKNSKLSDQVKSFNEFYTQIEIQKPDYCVFNCGKSL